MKFRKYKKEDSATICSWIKDEKDNSTVRFGYVIVDPAIRGCGKGKEMYKMTIGEWECIEMELPLV